MSLILATVANEDRKNITERTHRDADTSFRRNFLHRTAAFDNVSERERFVPRHFLQGVFLQRKFTHVIKTNQGTRN